MRRCELALDATPRRLAALYPQTAQAPRDEPYEMNLSDLRFPTPCSKTPNDSPNDESVCIGCLGCKLAFSNKHASRLFDDALQFSVIVKWCGRELQDVQCGSLSRKAK